jgi:predicted nicotinamide N-methyase
MNRPRAGSTRPSAGLLARHAPARPVDGVPGVLAHEAPDVVALWQAWEEECGCRQPPPFWAAVWPAAAVLARCVTDGTVGVARRRVLEIGCGGAVVAIAAALRGAVRVEANDVDAAALHVARRNARASGVELQTSDVDYAGLPLPAVDVVLVADLFYERGASARLLARLVEARARGIEVVVADGGRPFAPTAGIEPIREERVPVDTGLEGVAARSVRVCRLA